MTRITGSHHVLGIKHLLGQLRNGEWSVLLASSGSEGSKSRHEKVETGEGDHIDGKLSKVSIELARETEARGHSRHGQRDKMVQVSIGGIGQSESAEADIIESLIVNAVSLISVLHKLVHREGGIVGLNNSIRHLGGWNNRVGVHDPVGVLLSDLWDEESSHARSSATSKRVSELKSLKTITGFRLFTHNVEYRVNKFST